MNSDTRPITDASKRARRRCQARSNGSKNQHQWPGLKVIGMVVRRRETADKTTTETVYYLLSRVLSPERLSQVVRQHSAIENSLHWRLDVVMNEDQDRTRMGTGRTISLFYATWPSTPCKKRDQRTPCAESSSAPASKAIRLVHNNPNCFAKASGVVCRNPPQLLFRAHPIHSNSSSCLPDRSR